VRGSRQFAQAGDLAVSDACDICLSARLPSLSEARAVIPRPRVSRPAALRFQAPRGPFEPQPPQRATSGVLWDKLCAMSDDRAVNALERRMNRPLALALATLVVSIGVFFAGFMLIVEPTSKVTFPPELAVTTPAAGQTRILPVRVDQATSGPIGDNGLAGRAPAVAFGADAQRLPSGTTSP
jgi:hypothetical protein